MSTAILNQVANWLAEPFVRTGVYPNAEQALKHIFLDYIQRQIAWAEVAVQRYEQKHGAPFATWTRAIAGKATIADEDEWMEWEAVLDMLAGWRQIQAEIEQNYV